MKITTDINIILKNEEENKDYIYLYPKRQTAWVAYGKSAVNLNHLYPNITCWEENNEMSGKYKFMFIDKYSVQELCESGLEVLIQKEIIKIKMP